MRLYLCVWHKQGMHDYIHLVHATYRIAFRRSPLFCMVLAVIQRIPLSLYCCCQVLTDSNKHCFFHIDFCLIHQGLDIHNPQWKFQKKVPADLQERAKLSSDLKNQLRQLS